MVRMKRIKRAYLFLLNMLATKRLTGHFLPLRVKFHHTGIRFKCKRHRTAKVEMDGCLEIMAWMHNYQTVTLILSSHSTFRLDGDFAIGPNCRIVVAPKASLRIGGKETETNSGITANSLIMVMQSIDIGKDFLCACDAFITDSDHHEYGGRIHSESVVIGNHVWMTQGCSILKGVHIGDNCVIGNKSVVLKGDYSAQSLIVGNPAKCVATAKTWHY